jgi:Tfp pilus assembly protein PilN
MTTVCQKRGGWHVRGVASWARDDQLRRILLFGKAITVGVASIWRRSQDALAAEAKTGEPGGDSAVPSTMAAELQMLQEAMVFNCTSIVPDDAFLAVLPLVYGNAGQSDFISIFAEGHFFRVGLIIDQKLVGVYKMSPAAPSRLAGHLGRLERYWQSWHPGTKFPTRIYTIGALEIAPEQLAPAVVTRLSLGAKVDKDPIALKGCGVALSGLVTAAPLLQGPTDESTHRRSRAGILYLAAAVLILGVMGTVATLGIRYWYDFNARAYEKKYQQVFENNQEIRTLVDQTNQLARTIVRLQETFSNQTNWGRLLEDLGAGRPEGLYLERLGCQPVANDSARMQLALTGWVSREELVTSFIARLQKIPYVSQIKLSSMQRDKVKTSETQFKIICILKLTEK